MRNSFDRLMKDVISIVKDTGERVDSLKANVSSTGVSCFDSRLTDGSFAVEEGDFVLRQLPNGLVERYLILDTEFSPGLQSIPSHYSMKVRKETAIRKENSASVQNIFNVSNNSRVNFHSNDHSVNISNNSEMFSQPSQAIDSQLIDENLKLSLLVKVAELQSAQGTPSFTSKFQEFMSLAANSMTVISPFLPQLSILLS